MAIIRLETFIKSDLKSCFDLSRDIDFHSSTVKQWDEKAIAGCTKGLINLNETVTWRAKPFLIYFTLTTKIIEMHSPHRFEDIMLRGPFKMMSHQHIFESKKQGTVMTDIFEFKSPFWLFGRLADFLILKGVMRRMLTHRNNSIKVTLEKRKS